MPRRHCGVDGIQAILWSQSGRTFMAKPIIKILIIDDDANIRESIRLALEEQDYVTVEITESGGVASGIQQAKTTNPDVVILDLHMPNKNGWDFMNILHKDMRLAKTRVIMLTADDTPDNTFRAEKKGIGAYQFLAKPFNISELQALVLNLPIKR
jgi:DNA-binding response OmpR family regulator